MAFVIPVNHGDLLLGTRDRFNVAEELKPSRVKVATLIAKLEEVQDNLKTDALAIALNANFDVLWSVARNYSGFEGAVHAKLFDALRTGINGLTKKCEAFLKAKPSASNDAYKQELERYLQPLKMLVYVLNMAIVEGEKLDSERVKAVKGRKKAVVDKGGDESQGWVAGAKIKEKTLVALLSLMDLDLARFWGLSFPEDEFCMLLTRVAGALLENPANLKQKELKANVFLLYSKLVQKYNQSIHITPLISNQLHNHKHVADPLAALMHDMAAKHDNADFVGGVVREIGRLDLGELSKDSAAAKNVAAFIVSLAGRLPKVVLQNISMLVPQLDAELYVLRNGVIEAMGELILKGFDANAKDEGGAQTRDKLFEYLQERFLDSSVFTRTLTLRTWASLVEARVVPVNIALDITELTVRRLNDKGANVRKEALRLLTVLLRENQLFPVLRVSALRERLDAVEARLAQAYAELNAAAAAAAPAPVVEVGDKENDAAGAGPAPVVATAQPVAMSQERADSLARDLAERARFKMTLQFAEALDRAAQTMCRMMGSKSKTDVVEVIAFFTTAKNFQLEGAERGFCKMLALLWSKEAAVRDAVVGAYRDAYLSTLVLGNEQISQRESSFRIARSLIGLAEGATLAQLTSLELLIAEFTRADLVEPSVVNALWALFAGPDANEARGAIALLSMMAVVQPDTVRDHVDALVRVGLLDRARWQADPLFAKFVCTALQRMGGTAETRYPSSHRLFETLVGALDSWGGTAARWCQSAEQVINTIYALCDHPDAVMEPIIRSMTARVLAPAAVATREPGEEDAGDGANAEAGGVSADGLARLLFLVGHVALKELLQVEAIKLQVKSKRDEKERRKKEQAAGGDGKGDKRASVAGVPDDDGLEAELGVAEQNDAMEEEHWNAVVDRKLVGANLLGAFAPVLQRVLLNEGQRYASRTLQAVASLSLAKFMAVSDSFCTRNLQLLFTVLERQPDERIRANIIIALGDLSYRFPNRVEGWNASIYARLQDPSNHVRKTTIMVLTHLILNGVIKIKNNGGLLALAVIDEDARIAEFSRQFFMKLALTDKGIYNAIPDIVSSVSARVPRLAPASFRLIMEFVFGFIENETQNVSLIEKLCGRFDSTSALEQWRDLACCLAMLSYNERGIKKLYDSAAHFKDLCHDDDIYSSIAECIAKSRKLSKASQAAAELQKMIDECYSKRHPGKALPGTAGAAPKRRAAPAGKASRKRAAADDDDDDGDDDNDDDDDDDDDVDVGESAAAGGNRDDVAAQASAPTTVAAVAVPARAEPAIRKKPAARKPAAGRKPASAAAGTAGRRTGKEAAPAAPRVLPTRARKPMAAPIVDSDGDGDDDDDSLSLHGEDDDE